MCYISLDCEYEDHICRSVEESYINCVATLKTCRAKPVHAIDHAHSIPMDDDGGKFFLGLCEEPRMHCVLSVNPRGVGWQNLVDQDQSGRPQFWGRAAAFSCEGQCT